MKKKNLILLLAAFLSFAFLPLRAEDISLAKAQAAAENFFSQCGVDTRAGSTLTLLGTDLSLSASTRSSQQPAYYIFNRAGGGFVIISALDAAVPVLGYSFEHSFSLDNDMPENLREWMGLYSEQIAGRRASGKAATKEELARWDEAMTPTRGGTAPASIDLKTPDWGQGAPYNRKCPLDTTGKRSLVGCTATAISELMFYHKHPDHGTGTLPGYTAKGITTPSLTLGDEYQWDLMLSKYSGASYTTAQADAAALLCYQVAVMAQASFGSSATSASTTNAAPRLATYMGYSAGLVRYSRDYSTAEQWKSMLKAQLQDSLPILFSASSESGSGHAFLVDGYDEADRFLVNFGWNGTSNGYYQIDAFGSFTVSQRAFTGLKPSEGEDWKDNLLLRTYTSGSTAYNGLVPRSGTFSTGNTVKIRFGAVYNYGYQSFSGRINFAHVDKDGVVKGSMMRATDLTLSLSADSYTYFSTDQQLQITEPIERGDRIKPFYRRNGVEEWTAFGYNASQEALIPELPLHIQDYTSVDFVVSTRKMTITTFPASKYVLKDENDIAVKQGTVASTGTIILSTSSYSGRYLLTITAGTQELTLELVF